MDETALRAKIFSKVDELPTLPVVLPKLLSLMESKKSDAAMIAEAISNDPALTSKVLKVANSAYYGFSQEIYSLDKAVPLLGLNMVRSLALSIGVMESLHSGGEETNHFSREELWIHSLAVATAVQELVNATGKPKQNEHLFVVGLLHDIGKIVLDQFFSELFSRALEQERNGSDFNLAVSERKIMGMDHGEVGRILLKRWKFPSIIFDPIAVHHDTDVPDGTDRIDVALLRVADHLSKEIGFGSEEIYADPDTFQKDLGVLGVDKGLVSKFIERLIDREEGIRDFFSALK